MAKLTSKARSAIPSKDFALPGKRAYPIEDRSHAANAKARASGKPEQGKVDAAVARKYPDMGKSSSKGSRGTVPKGEHYAPNHREPRNADEFHTLGNPKGGY
jgi:hypothetical protein